MKNLTTAQLEQVHELALRLVHPRLIAQAVGLTELEFRILVEDKDTELHERYYEGHIQAKLELHEAIIKSAKNGSNPSQVEMKKLITESENFLSNG